MEAQGITTANLALIPLLPLVGSALAFTVGKKNRDAAGWIATAASFLAFLWALKLFLGLDAHQSLEQNLFTWFSFKTITVDFLLRLDQLSAVMCLVVTGIGSLIHLYSVGYMHEDESRHRFFAYLNLFMFSMLTLVLGGNLLILFIGWEGVGLCSYLLIGFWYKNLSYAAAGRKAFVVNRIGDVGFLIAIFFLMQAYQTLDFTSLQSAMEGGNVAVSFATVVALCLFVGATGKSAQIPLFVWLPDAMAGPTPVSALIHAATMVTAGVYMMARTHFIFSLAPEAMAVVTVIAALTAFVAGTTALTQNDIKKVLAYSTVSQLGFMFMAAGSGAYWVAIFHVVTHAFFKACLFLCAGSVIHGCHHEQDMRHMGGLRKMMPLTFATYLLSTLAIAGIAPLSGYYSKHAIMAALGENHLVGSWVVALATLTAFITAFYMTRSLVMTFFGEYRGHAHPHESPWTMTVPLVILAILAVGGGALGGPLAHYIEHVIPAGAHHFHAEGILDSILHSWLGILGVAAGFLLYISWRDIPETFYKAIPPLSKLLTGKYFFDEIYGKCIVTPLEGLAKVLWKGVDQACIDGAVNGTGAVVEISGEIARTVETGQVRTYAFFMLLGTVLLIALYIVM